jgi:hypothetical protein
MQDDGASDFDKNGTADSDNGLWHLSHGWIEVD